MQYTDKSETDKKANKTRIPALIMRTMMAEHKWFLKGVYKIRSIHLYQ